LDLVVEGQGVVVGVDVVAVFDSVGGVFVDGINGEGDEVEVVCHEFKFL
jgi:hypothetical protein